MTLASKLLNPIFNILLIHVSEKIIFSQFIECCLETVYLDSILS